MRRICPRSEEHTSELQSRGHLVCRLLLEKKERRGSEEHTSELQSRGHLVCRIMLEKTKLLAGSPPSAQTFWVVARAGTILLTTDSGNRWMNFFFNTTEDTDIFPLSLPQAFPI